MSFLQVNNPSGLFVWAVLEHEVNVLQTKVLLFSIQQLSEELEPPKFKKKNIIGYK